MSVDVLSFSFDEPLAPTGSSSLPNPTTEESGRGPVADPEPTLSPEEIITALYDSFNSLRSLVGDVEANGIVKGALASQTPLSEGSDGHYRLVLKSLLKVEHQIMVGRLARDNLPANALKRIDSLAPDISVGGKMQGDSHSLSMLLLAVKVNRQRYKKADKNGVAANDTTTSDSQQQQETVEESLAVPGPTQSMLTDDVLPPDTAEAAALTADSALATTEGDGTNETQESTESTADQARSAVTPAAAAPVVDFKYLDHVQRTMLTLGAEFAELLKIESATRQAVNNYLFAYGSEREAACNKWFLDEFVKLVKAHMAVEERLGSLEDTMALLRDHRSTLRKRYRRIRTRIRRSGRGRPSKMHTIHLPAIKDLVESYESVRSAHFQLIRFVLVSYRRAVAKGWNHEDEGNEELVDYLESIQERWKARSRMKLCRGRLPRDKVLSSSSLSGESDEEEEDALVASSR